MQFTRLYRRTCGSFLTASYGPDHSTGPAVWSRGARPSRAGFVISHADADVHRPVGGRALALVKYKCEGV